MGSKEVLKELGLHFMVVEPEEGNIMDQRTPEYLDKVKVAPLECGLELMDDKKAILIERIKKVIIEMVHYAGERAKTNFSDYLNEKLNHKYTYLSSNGI